MTGIQTAGMPRLSRYALFALACLLMAITALALTPAADARQLALVFPPGTAEAAMFLAAARLDLRPVARPGRWPVLIAATGDAGWRGVTSSPPYLFVIAVDGFRGCSRAPLA